MGRGKRRSVLTGNNIIRIIAGVLVLGGLYLTSLYNYLLFHSLAEIFSIVVACGTFLIFWNSRRFLDNNYFLFIGIAYLFIAGLDLVHTLAYKGMGVFPEYDANLPTQLWIAARYVESLSLLAAPLCLNRKFRPWLALAGYTVLTALLLASIFYWDIFPACYVEGVGLTPFKKISEYVISLILLVSGALLYRRRQVFDQRVFQLLVLSIILTIGSELAFTFYISVYGFSNLVGHFLKIVSFYLVYWALIQVGLTKPYNVLFRNLKQSEEALKEYSERLEQMVTERTAELQAQYARLEAILHSVGDAILVIDQDKRVRYVNPAFTALTGYTSAEVLGEHASSVGAGAESEQVQRSIALAVDRGETWQGEVCGRRKDGRVYDAALIITPVRDAKGHISGYVSSHRDISQLKDLERARSQFIANVSHQLRTPVATIQLYAHLLREGKQPDQAKDFLQIMEDEAIKLIHLIEDILEMTTLDSGKAVTAWEPVSLRTMAENTITQYQVRAANAGLDLTAVPFPSDLPVVKGDYARLAQALGEIVENAIAFTPSGGRVEIQTVTTEDSCRTWVTIAVRDTGSGIPPEEREKVFDRFFRGSAVESGHLAGTGLGLSIAREIIRAHGGQVTVESMEDKGSTFTIWLPIADREQIA